MRLPDGFRAGHFTDREGWTGCTALLAPEGSVAAGEVRGGGPGTRESDLLSPATSTPGPQAVLLTGGSAFGLAAADGVVRWLEERGLGYPTPAGSVPLVTAGVLFDLMLGSAKARPGPDDAYAACEAAGPEIEGGSVGAGTGATAGKLLGPGGWTKAGLGVARIDAGDAEIVAVAAANPFGDIVDADGSVLAGVWDDVGYVRSVDLVLGGRMPRRPVGENTTLAVVLTDARLDKTQAWLVARAMSSGVARAVQPSGTAVDGDLAICMASGAVEADPLVVSVLAAEAVAEAIRDAARSATSAPECPSLRDRMVL
jgi:L-aminopeptidase/D-esterase-like protein